MSEKNHENNTVFYILDILRIISRLHISLLIFVQIPRHLPHFFDLSYFAQCKMCRLNLCLEEIEKKLPVIFCSKIDTRRISPLRLLFEKKMR